MKGLSLLVARVLTAFALIVAPMLHASAVCAETVSGDRTAQIAEHHAGGSHASEHGVEHRHASDRGLATPHQHDGKTCCDMTCNMACAAVLPAAGAVFEPAAANSLADSSPLRSGFSPAPEFPPPKPFHTATVAA